MAGKKIVTKGKANGKFEITNLETQTVVFTGFFQPEPGDFGDYSVEISVILREQDIII